MACRERRWAIALCTLSLAATAQVHAEVPAEKSATARALFDQARALLAEQDYERACVKFEESQRLDPGGGTLLNLAVCNELRGRTATAWAQFDEALRWARRDGRPDREKLAKEHLDALTPRLARLVILVEPRPPPGLVVSRNGVELGAASLGEALPVDPGEHAIEARAPGKKPFRAVARARPGGVSTLTIPTLLDDPAAAPPPPAAVPARPAEPSPRTEPSAARTWGTLLIGSGAAVTIAGGWFGLRAIDHKQEADALCPKRECSNQTAVDLNADAQTSAVVSTLLVAGGLAMMGGGAFLVFGVGSQGSEARFALGRRF
jgi:tetratricopeptide (TPR) repeat protein